MKRVDLVTPRLRLRAWTDDDRGPFAALNADPRVMEFFPSVLSRLESDALAVRIAAHIDTLGWGLWAVEVPGATAFAGYVGLAEPTFAAPFTPCVEIGWRLAHDETVSFTVPANLRSRRVMERLGMTRAEADDFDHPGLQVEHPLRRHVLYRIHPQPEGSVR